jgi:4-hydroxy-3-methylbut-2-enyl diphosphate reductase
VVVVGGRKSNNTRQLVLRCQERGLPAYHVQGPDDLQPEWFDGIETVGLTAGTSTLDETIDAVYQALAHHAVCV